MSADTCHLVILKKYMCFYSLYFQLLCVVLSWKQLRYTVLAWVTVLNCFVHLDSTFYHLWWWNDFRWVLAFGLNGDGGCRQQQPTGGLTAQAEDQPLLGVILHSINSRAFRISAPTTWNSLPQNVRECSSLASFGNHLKTHYFSSSFSALWHLTCVRLTLLRCFMNHLLKLGAPLILQALNPATSNLVHNLG